MSKQRLGLLLYVSILLGALIAFSSIALHLYSSAFLKEKADVWLESYTRKISQELEHQISRDESNLDILLSDRMIGEYFMYSQFGKLDDAEDVRWKVERRILNIVRQKSGYTAIRILGLDGKSVVDVSSEGIGYAHLDFSKTSWFKEVLNLGRNEWYISKIYTCLEHNEPEILLSRVYLDDVDVPRGAVVEHFHVGEYFAEIFGREAGHHGYAYLIDGRGVIVAHGDRDRIGTGVETLESTRSVLAGNKGLITENDPPGNSSMRKAYLPLHTGGLALVLVQPLSEMLEFGRPLRVFSLAVCIATLIFVAVIVYVITRLRETEKEVTRSYTEVTRAYSELYQIFNTAADAMCIVDKDHNVLLANDTYSTLTGVRGVEVAGKKCYELFPGDACHTPRCTLTRVLRSGEPVEYEAEKVRGDGTRIPCIVRATPYLSPEGELIGIVEDFRDISARVLAEQQRLERQGLQGVVEMAGAVCHELNQPMQVIAGYCELLMADISHDDGLYEDARQIHSQVGRMKEITTKLMRITRYETCDYIGGTRIIDIDKASAETGGTEPQQAEKGMA